MDWDRAIERNREALLRIVSALFGMLAAARMSGPAGFMVPRRVWAAVLFVLRPAEAAVRRLVVIAARGMTARYAPPRTIPAGGFAQVDVPRAPVFRLIDPLKDFSSSSGDDGGSGFHIVNGDAGFFGQSGSHPDAPINGVHLHVRLRALRHALADLARQARRLARWQARRDVARKAGKPTRISVMRPGLPPGWRSRGKHEIDPVLRECHRLARDLLNAPDTS
jgi:hypothetical protein